jgi:regulator of protease activity HflC (stomatin/prohibitin superfamily)
MDDTQHSAERIVRVFSGWPMLAFNLAWPFAAFGIIRNLQGGAALAFGVFAAIVWIILLSGHFSLQPNEARVLILFGAYKGTVRESGFWWGNPFYAHTRAMVTVHPPAVTTRKNAHGKDEHVLVTAKRSSKISLRVNNFNSDRLKVNDKRGNPIEIAAVIVWRVSDTARAAFDVEDYETYVQIQSESAIRHVASSYAYDHGEDREPTLRESGGDVATALRNELHERMHKAGIAIVEARLTHLAYAPEIAQAMLRRQQAEAVIAARQQIVQGAVSMVEMALNELASKQVIQLDEERKAAMVSNLLVVLCSESETSPVINTGTLYQ